MSDLNLVRILETILQLVILVVIIVKTVRSMINGKHTFLPFFFALAMASCLLSNLYWIAYDTLRPDTRMPIASNEIAECAVILLLSAGLDSILKDKKDVLGEAIFAFLFISVNIVLWILWSGEWFQDILFGLPYIYFFWLLIRGLRSRMSLTRNELWFSAIMSISFLVMQFILFAGIEIMNGLIKTVCYMVMFALMIWLGIKSVRSKDFFVTTTYFLWTNLSIFLSPDIYYYIVALAETVAFPLMFVSMKKELAADDWC